MRDASNITQTDAWHFLRRYPPTFLERPFHSQLFGQWIIEAMGAIPNFEERLREAARHAISLDDAQFIRRGLQCLAHLGTREDLARLDTLAESDDPLVARDARTCAFAIRERGASG